LFGVVDKSEVIGFKLFEDPNITGEKKAELLKNRSVRFESEFNFEEVKRLKLYQTTCSGIKILDWSTTPLIVDDLLIGYVVQVQDITEQKRAEQALENINAMHHAMTENIGDVIGIMGVDGIMKYKSANIEKFFGWKPEDLVGTDGWKNTVYPEDIDRIQKAFYSLLQKDNSSKTVEYRYICSQSVCFVCICC